LTLFVALGLLVLIGSMVLAIELQRASHANARVQTAIDSAVLSVGKNWEKFESKAQAEAHAKQILVAMIGQIENKEKEPHPADQIKNLNINITEDGSIVNTEISLCYIFKPVFQHYLKLKDGVVCAEGSSERD